MAPDGVLEFQVPGTSPLVTEQTLTACTDDLLLFQVTGTHLLKTDQPCEHHWISSRNNVLQIPVPGTSLVTEQS